MQMTALSLLDDDVVRVVHQQQPLRLSLPSLLALLTTGADLNFVALRPHQQPAWHAFLVTLAFHCLEAAGTTDLPSDAAGWRALMQGLTSEFPDGEPWCLVVDDWEKPAFLQSPCAANQRGDYKRRQESVQEIDLLITSKNHDEKLGKMHRPGLVEADAPLYALVSLQGFAAYGGRTLYNTMRMNGSSSSRPQFRLVFERGAGAEFLRDLKALLTHADGMWQAAAETGLDIGSRQAQRLLWLPAWGDESLSLRDVHPWCLEVTRRVRLAMENARLHSLVAGSASPRVAAKDRAGLVLDPWVPINRKDAEPKALTVSTDSFQYHKLAHILFDPAQFELPVLAQPSANELQQPTGATLVAQVTVGGNCTTDGVLRREVFMPMPVLRRRSQAPNALALRSQRFIDAASTVQRSVLRPALIQFFDGTDAPNWKSPDAARAVQPWTTLFETQVDEVFYAKLFESISKDWLDEPAAVAWFQALEPIAEGVFAAAVEAMPCSVASRLMARGRAQRVFDDALKKHFGGLMQAATVPIIEAHHDLAH
jgi:CRISPR system Cascade subunit CasA